MQVFFGENGTGPACFVLERVPDAKKPGTYFIDKKFVYRDPKRHEAFVVPREPGKFQTDLASIPGVATWLVPKDGTHTPAALMHDAMVRPSDTPAGTPLDYVGRCVSREDADLIFREAMGYLGVPFLQRWLVWGAVAMATRMSPKWADEPGPKRPFWLWRLFIGLLALVLVPLGLVSVLDLADIHTIYVPGLGKTLSTALPWMGVRSVGRELLGGLVVAAVLAAIVPWLWLKHWRIGLVFVLAVIPLAFPLAVSAAGYGLYLAAELTVYGLATVLGLGDPARPKFLQRFD